MTKTYRLSLADNKLFPNTPTIRLFVLVSNRRTVSPIQLLTLGILPSILLCQASRLAFSRPCRPGVFRYRTIFSRTLLSQLRTLKKFIARRRPKTITTFSSGNTFVKNPSRALITVKYCPPTTFIGPRTCTCGKSFFSVGPITQNATSTLRPITSAYETNSTDRRPDNQYLPGPGQTPAR